MTVRADDPHAVILASMRELVRGLDADSLSPADAAVQAEWFEEMLRLAAAGKAVLVQRAVEGELWLQSGDRSAADWLAKRTGSTIAEARSVIDTGNALRRAPLTDAEFRAGRLSLKQAEAVAGAALDPSEEPRLLALAHSQSLQKLRDECARVRAAAVRIRKRRISGSIAAGSGGAGPTPKAPAAAPTG